MVEKLRSAYYPDPTNDRAIRDGNIALLTNLYVADYELQSIATQADVNNQDASTNTYFFRLRSTEYNLCQVYTKLQADFSSFRTDSPFMMLSI